MKDEDRFKLYFGPYKTPRFKYGQIVWCEYRGNVKIVGLSDGSIPWPIGRPTAPNPGRDSLIIFQGLKNAIQTESNQAVAHWWGVAIATVGRWRKALGVGRNTPGTEWTLAASLKAESRRDKIAKSRTGKPRPKHVLEALRKSHLGKPLGDATRKKMSVTHKRRGTIPPKGENVWTKEELRLLRKLPPVEVAERTGRTLTAVYRHRSKLKLSHSARMS